MNHKLKTWTEYFLAVLWEEKTFEVRRNDRDFNVGDLLTLEEWNPDTGYTGRSTERKVIYKLNGGQFGIEKGYVVLSIEKP